MVADETDLNQIGWLRSVHGATVLLQEQRRTPAWAYTSPIKSWPDGSSQEDYGLVEA